jgi:hypothetical protein
MLVFANLDVPGVIGRIDLVRAPRDQHRRDAARARTSRGRAVSVLNLDDPMPPAALDEIRAMPISSSPSRQL